MTTAEIAIVSASAVGLAGVLGPSLTAWLDRTQRRELAQAERRHAHRSQVYARAGGFLERQRLVLYRTEPMIGPLGDPPEPLPDDAWMDLEGSIAVASSEEVLEAIRSAHRRGNEFVYAVETYRRLRDHPIQQEAGAAAGVAMHEARERALKAIDTAERVMRDELAAL